MFWRTLGISFLALLLLALRHGAATIVPIPPASPKTREAFLLVDAESLFAAGRQVPIGCAQVGDLELISGISDTIAKTLVTSREDVGSSGTTPLFRERLLSVKGIGPKLADMLLSFLSPTVPCPESYSSARSRDRFTNMHSSQGGTPHFR